jgi:sugar phosphate isomerase/epimerase
MRCGIMNNPMKALVAELDAVAALEFDFVELCMDAPQAHHSTIRENLPRIRRRLSRSGMQAVCHLPTFVYTADLTESIRKASLDETLRSLEVAAELEAVLAVLHPSRIHPLGARMMELSLRFAAESLGAVTRRAETLGLRLCLENMFPKFLAFFEPGHFDDTLARHPAMGLTLDIAHAHIGNPDGTRALAFIRRFGDRIGHVHASDNRFTRDDHLPLGGGAIDFAKVIACLKQAGYDGTVTLEIFSDDRRHLTASRDRWRALWAQTAAAGGATETPGEAP